MTILAGDLSESLLILVILCLIISKFSMDIAVKINLLRNLNSTIRFEYLLLSKNWIELALVTFVYVATSSATMAFDLFADDGVSNVGGQQVIGFNYKYIPQNSFEIVSGNQRNLGSSFDGLEFNPTIEGLQTANARFSNTVNPLGQFKTRANLEIMTDNNQVDDYLTEINVGMNQSVQFIDQFQVNDPNAFSVRFLSIVTGSLSHEIGSFGEFASMGPASYENKVNFMALGSSLSEELKNSFPGGFEPAPVNGSKSVTLDIISTDLQLDSLGQSLFSWEFTESIVLELTRLDVGKIDATFENDLSNTINLYASVYDINGDIIPNAQVESAFGFTYEQIPTSALAPVPVPAAAWLFISGLIGLAWKGRKSR